MSVSVLLVLGDKIRSAIEEHVQEQWLLSYVGKITVMPSFFERETSHKRGRDGGG